MQQAKWREAVTQSPLDVLRIEKPVLSAPMAGLAGPELAAAMMLGTSGVWIETRPLASSEATIHEVFRNHILRASEADTQWVHDLYDAGWPDAPHRALSNSTYRGWVNAGCSAPGNRLNEEEHIGPRPNGDPVIRYKSYTPLPETVSDVEAMSPWSGQSVSSVRKLMPAREIVEDIY